MNRIYFDYNATTPLSKEVLDFYTKELAEYRVECHESSDSPHWTEHTHHDTEHYCYHDFAQKADF